MMTKRHAQLLRFDRVQAQAALNGHRVDAGNDAPRCPWLYDGFEEPPALASGGQSGTLQAGELENCLNAIGSSVVAEWRHSDG